MTICGEDMGKFVEEITKKKALPSTKDIMRRGYSVKKVPLKKVVTLKKAKLSDLKGVLKVKR